MRSEVSQAALAVFGEKKTSSVILDRNKLKIYPLK